MKTLNHFILDNFQRYTNYRIFVGAFFSDSKSTLNFVIKFPLFIVKIADFHQQYLQFL